jgi:hypothetical protein
MAATPTRTLSTQRRAGKGARRRDPKPPAQRVHSTPPRGRAKLAAKGLYGYIWAISGRAQILLALLSVNSEGPIRAIFMTAILRIPSTIR